MCFYIVFVCLFEGKCAFILFLCVCLKEGNEREGKEE